MTAVVSSAQELSNLRHKVVAVTDTVLLDSLSVVPGSVYLKANGKTISPVNYTVLPAEGKLVWKPGLRPRTDSVQVNYRVFPVSLIESIQHKDIKLIEPDDPGLINPFSYTTSPVDNSVLNMQGLNKQGSISRGISFGNSQDLSVNSSLNLQLSGKVSDKVSVLAAITDDNIPIQPEGNTQQLQEFDQVYIQLFDERSKLRVGDFPLKRPDSYYLNYFKRAQGGSFSTSFITKKTSIEDKNPNRMKLQASAAISKGKFARNIIQGIEGNQGPYRLHGAENETFIIVLSGTESVYIDGQLLTRGQENDYVIDYNTAQLTFTARRLITKDKRLIVEFQYSDKNYARSLFQFTDEYTSKKLKLRFNFYSEQDSKNQPLQLDLTDLQKALLANIGDSLDDAISPSVQIEKDDTINAGAVLYRRVDSLGYDTVYIYYNDTGASRTTDTNFYRLGFSNVGAGNGNYIQDFTSTDANGKMYKWMAPDTAGNVLVRNGSFEPIVLLITPKQKQMITLGGEYKLSDNTLLTFEGALSNEDLNTFSDIHATDNLGHAFRVSIANKKPLSATKTDPWNLVTSVGYEQVHKNFTPIERFRSVEFDRDWNIRDASLQETQHIPTASVGIAKLNVGNLNYRFNAFISEDEFNGNRHAVTTLLNTDRWNINATSSYMESNGSVNNTEFLRGKGMIAHKFKILTIGVREDYEKNRFRTASNDSLLGNSYEFHEWEAFISNVDTAKNRYTLSYTQRDDYSPINGNLNQATHGQSVAFGFDIVKNRRSTLRGKTTYRILTITDSNLTAQKPDSTLLSRLEYSVKLFKGAVQSTSFYEIGSGLEVKKEFSYIEVTPGQGVYTWIDRNNNTIKELDEFEVAAFADQANFIRIFIPTTEFEKIFSNQFNQLLMLRPAAVWNNKKGLRKFITRFSNHAAYRIDRKTNLEDFQTRFNPFLQQVNDTHLRALNSSFRNTFFFNKTNPKFGVDLNYQDIRNKLLLTSGTDTRSNIFKGITMRWNMTRKFMLNLEYKEGEKSNSSELSSSRNYNIDYYQAEPRITLQPGTTFRAALFFNYSDKMNTLTYDPDRNLGEEHAVLQKIGTDIKITSVGKGSLLLNAQYIQITYTNPVDSLTNNTSVAFEMLEGLQPGQNGTWSVSYQRTLANNLQLSLNYNGRKSEGVNMIHAGGVQVRAFF